MKIRPCIGFALFSMVALFHDGLSDVQRVQAWNPPPAVLRLPAVPSDLQPTLPAPTLKRETEYTWGRSNTLFWSTDSVLKRLPQDVSLLFFEVQALFSGNEWWGFVDAGTDSAVFEGLPEGIPIEYRLRYYGRGAGEIYLLSHWSASQVSIQDNHPPAMLSWSVVGIQQTQSGNWVVGQSPSIQILAEDSNGGKIMEAAIREIGPAGDHILFVDFQRPRARIDTMVSYTLQAPRNRQTELSVWVKDVSGQSSPSSSMKLSWWQESGEPKMLCFPNPFNPDRGQWSTVKVSEPGTTEARVLDPFGNLVRILRKQPDQKFFQWDGRNEGGQTVSNGAYLCVLKENQRLYCKIVVLK
ncbi:MAG TPA: hypothetical protein VGB38_01250 [bacterium]